jgi:diguanylate cyclase (GGDEF)-like protein
VSGIWSVREKGQLMPLSESLLAFVDSGLSQLFAAALATICLLQYVAHLYRLRRVRREVDDARKQRDEVRRRLAGVTSELGEVKRDRTINRFEAQALREFVAQQDCEKAVRAFIRRFIPNPDEGFAAFYLRREDGQLLVSESHGLEIGPEATFDLEGEFVPRLTRGGMMTLSRQEARQTRLWKALSPSDRSKIQQLHLFGVGSSDDLPGVLMTTALGPSGVETVQQIELTRRLLSSVTFSLRDKLQLETKEDQLRSTEEMLALRSVIDRNFDSPAQMLEEFLRQAAEKLNADRAALYLIRPDLSGPPKGFIRCGEALPIGVKELWQRHEDELAQLSGGPSSVHAYSAAELEQQGIVTLIGSAMVVPVLQHNRPLGLVCFSRRSCDPFSEGQQSLAGWAGNLLADVIPRVASQAVVERQARLDGLTQLANRGEFDREIRQQVQSAARQGTSLSLLMFDLDRFKSINDTYGHRAGDAVLRAAAGLIRDCLNAVRSTDRTPGSRPFVARYGGEELAVLLQLNRGGARRIGEYIRTRLEEQPLVFEGQRIRVTTSVGLATLPGDAASAEELIAASDAALYQAKANGRNRLEVAERATFDA